MLACITVPEIKLKQAVNFRITRKNAIGLIGYRHIYYLSCPTKTESNVRRCRKLANHRNQQDIANKAGSI